MSADFTYSQRESGTSPASEVDSTLSIILPALNEEDGIENVLKRILSTKNHLRAVGIRTLEVVVVDDGSADATAEIATRVPGVQVVKHPSNRGYGAALKTGFRHARGDLLAFLDADGTYPPESMATLCEALLHNNADIVIGSRRSGSESQMPAIRRIGNLLWSSLLTVIGSERVHDPASGLRVLKRDSLRQLYPLPDGLNFSAVMSTRALHEGIKVIELPIPYSERAGRSKLSVVRDGLRFLKTIIWTALEYNPARILEIIGFAALAVAATVAAGLLISRLRGITEISPRGLLAIFGSLILSVGGVTAFALGISSNHLVALFHSRPIRQRNFLSNILGHAPERHFGWLGFLIAFLGLTLTTISVVLGLNNWPLTRLWFWFVGSSAFLLVGVELFLFWILLRVLDGLNQREERIGNDLVRSVLPLTTDSVSGYGEER